MPPLPREKNNRGVNAWGKGEKKEKEEKNEEFSVCLTAAVLKGQVYGWSLFLRHKYGDARCAH